MSELGWILGEFGFWSQSTNDFEDGLLALLDIPPQDKRYPWGFARVQRVSEGYQALSPSSPSNSFTYAGTPRAEKERIKAMETVKRLAGQ